MFCVVPHRIHSKKNWGIFAVTYTWKASQSNFIWPVTHVRFCSTFQHSLCNMLFQNHAIIHTHTKKNPRIHHLLFQFLWQCVLKQSYLWCCSQFYYLETPEEKTPLEMIEMRTGCCCCCCCSLPATGDGFDLNKLVWISFTLMLFFYG